MRNADFRNGNYDTGFVERIMNSESFESEAVERTFARVTAPEVKSLARSRLYGILDLGYVEPRDADARRPRR